MIPAFLFLLLLASCFREPALDTSSEESFKESVEKIEKSLKGEELHKFQENIQFIENSHEDDKREYRKRSNGKTAKEFSEQVSMFVKEFNITYFQFVIDELVKKKSLSDNVNEEFKNLKVTKASIISRNDSKVLIAVENKTTYTISALSFKGIISAPERKTVWIEKKVFHDIPKGLEPGEKLSFEANMSSDPIYQKGSVPRGYDLSVALNGAWDHEHKMIFPDNKFSEKDQVELDGSRLTLSKLKGLK